LDFFKVLSPYFHFLIYTHQQESNAAALADKVEEQVGRQFTFVLSKGHLLDAKYRVRDFKLVESLGATEQGTIFVGPQAEDFRMIESNSIPLLEFYGSQEDCCLAQLSDYLLSRVASKDDVRVPIAADFLKE